MGEKGEPGSQGDNGEKGEMGIKGENGLAGDNGTKGSAGNNGEKGDMGEKGTKGELGDQGEKGERGIKGAEGDEGIRGGNGFKGMKGEKGKQGNTTRGPSGEVGDQGPKGVRGEQGTTGITGGVGEKGDPGERGTKGIKGSKGVTGTGGEKGMVGKNLLILAINSTYNSNCQNYEKGQIIYDTAIGKFIFCDGDQFQCIPDKPCREDCKDGDPTINTINPNIPAQCVNLIYVIDESASMRPEQQWLRDVANAIPRELRRINYNPGVCMNNFGVLGFGTGEEASRAEQIGRPIDLGGIITQDQTFVPLWGSTSEVIRVINEGIFAGEGRREDGFAALYRALQRYTFVGVGCRKMLLITDEDRDNETPSPDPPYDRVPTLFNLNMQQILNQFSITLSAVISIQFQAQNDQQPNINYNTILGLLPNNSVIYYDENSQRNYSVASDGYVRRDSAAGNTEQTYFQQVRASGGIAWSLQASRTYRDAFTSAFLQFEIIPHVPQNNSTQASGGCMLDSCNACPCVDGERYCQPINNLDFNTTIKCRPTECNQTQIISGFRQPACIDMVFAFSETQTMLAEHDSIKDVATNLAINLAKINFGQENSLCPNTYCLVGFGSENNRNSDQCYTESFRIPPNDQLCAPSAQLANLIEGLALTATGNESDGYAAIYTALQTYKATFQSQSCRHITLVTDTNRLDCGSYTDGSVSIPQLSKTNIASALRDRNMVLNVIVNATFQDGSGNEALGIYQETNGSIVAVIPDSTAQFGFSTSPGGSVRLAGDQVEEDYIDLAIIVGGSAWDIRKMGEQTDLFTKAFVQAVVIKSSESCGQTRACVECKCVGGELQRCEESTVCNITGEVPILAYTSGNITVSMDNQFIQVGGYGSTEEVVYYGIDGDLVSTFTLNTLLRRGTVPVNITWYYVTEGGQMVPIEDSAVAQYVSVPQNNPYNLVFSQVGDAIQGSYLVVAENAYGRDTQLTNIGILPKWDKTLSGMVTGSEASLGQTLIGIFDSELRITGTVREGTEPWSFRLSYNGMELVLGQNYSVEYQGNQPIYVINNFRSSQIGEYMAIVSNRYGQDTHTFNLMAETLISCGNNVDDPSTTCRNCQFDEVTKNSTLTIYAHSFPRNLKLTWYRVDNITGQREQIAENTAVEGANSVIVTVTSLCDYNYEVVVEDENTYRFECECALPLLTYTYGNITIDQDNQMVLVGGYGSSEREVNYGLDGDSVDTFTIYSRLTRGTQPVNVTWYYITLQGVRVLIEDSDVADYVSAPQNNPYNLVFSQVGDAIQGSYLVVAENAYGRDTQLTNIGILPKWDKTLSGMVTGSQASLGQTLIGIFGSELRITGTVREGTEPWSFRWYYNGVEIVEGDDYSFEYSGNQATIVIDNFEDSDIGTYMAIVSNSYGQDTHTFNLMAETVVSCTDNITDTSTTCTKCLFDEETKQSTLTVYAHSISQDQNLTWYQVNRETGEREQLRESVVVEGANSIMVSVISWCNYSYEVVVEGQSTYQFQCVCALPQLDYTSGNVSITEDNQMVLVGGYGTSEREVNYGLDGDLVNTFTIYSQLTRGTQPVNVTWYYITLQGVRVLIEDSDVADYVSVPQNNPYNLVFSQVGDAIQGSYLVVAENAYGRDTQLTNIGILPKWDRTLSGMVTGSQASLGQTLVGRFGSELRITGMVREGTEPWSFRLYYNGFGLVLGQNYSVEYQDNQPIYVINNFRSSQIGEYMAIVSNRYGQDTHTFNLMAETVISCANNVDDPSTTCRNCQFDEVTKNSTLTIYAHSFPRNLKLTWYRVDNITGQREQIAENTAVEGANSVIVTVTSLCDYNYEVVVEDENTYRFECECALPLLTYTYGNITIDQDNQMVLVGGYGSSEREVNYGLDGDSVNTFTIYSQLTRGTEPVNVTWYYITLQGVRVLIEDSDVADYVSVPQNNPYNLVFSQVGDAIQGSYLVVAENAYGRDTQLTNIGILPKWDRTLSGMVTGSEASLGQTLVGRFGSELRITGMVREGTEPWSFRLYYNGFGLVLGQNYSVEYQDDQPIYVINNFRSSQIGEYMAIVSNRYGQDTHTFNLMAETVISCANNVDGPSTTCRNCQFDEVTKNSTLTIYAHSFPRNLKLTWYRVDNITGQREQIAENTAVEGANSVIVTVTSLCDYNYEVVVEDENTYRFECECALPLLTYTYGNITIDQDNQMVLVGGYGSSEREVNYGLDGDSVNTFTIYSQLTRGTEPVNVTWYYITSQGVRVLIEDSDVADYVSVPQNNPYNLVFSQVGDAIQGSYLVVAENAYGRDTQLTNIGILPKWDKTLSGMVTGSEASLGQTLVGRFGSELRITGMVREGTEPWSFRLYYNGFGLVLGQNYSVEYQDDQPIYVINNFRSSQIGEYMAIVSNRYGQDTHIFNLMAETVISCANNVDGPSTTCRNCQFDEVTKNSTLTIYAHSFPRNLKLTWYRVDNITGQREQIAENTAVEGANSVIVTVTSLCDYNYEVVVEDENTYRFECECALPLLTYTYGNITIDQDNQMVLVGGYGSSEREVNYGLDGDSVDTFTIYSRLTRGTEPVNVTWYYITSQGVRVLIEDSDVADYVSVPQNNPYNLVFSQVGDAIQGSYLVVAENAYGRDTQLTNIGILPKWDKTLSGMVTGSEASLGQTLFGRFGSELRITGTVREGTEPWSFRWYYNGVEIVEGDDYSFEYSGNQATIVIDNFEDSDIGTYMAIVSNSYGQDTHTFNLMAETVVSCTGNQSDPSTTCTSCQSNAQTRKSVLSVYAHSFPQNVTISWFQVNKDSTAEELIIENPIKVGVNSIERSVSDLCLYTYKAVVTNQNNYTFNCPCVNCTIMGNGETSSLSCCGDNQTLLTESDCGDGFYADVLLLIDVSASMQTEHAFLREFLPRFERSLQENCVGNSLINKNQYTAVAFGSLQSENKELPYFVGPNLNRGDSTQNVYFTIDVDNPINVTNTIDQLPTIGEREDGYAATRFAVQYAQLRDDSIKFAILVTDEGRQLFYGSTQEALDNTLIDPDNLGDLGRSLYTQFLLENNIIPIQIIDIALNAGTTQCLGVSSAETCFYRNTNSNVIENIEFAEVINTADSQLLQNVHDDYLQPALNARGYAWDLKVIRENETGNWDAITTALTNEVLLRAREELTQCRNCRCLPGGMQCQIVPLDQQAICKCEKSFPNNQPYCTCITEDEARPDICRCRHINGFSAAECQETGIITLVKT